MNCIPRFYLCGRLVLLLGAVNLLALLSIHNAFGNQDMRDEFLTQAPKSWREYIEFAKTLQGGYHLRMYDKANGNQLVTEMEKEIKQSGERQLSIERTFPPDKPGETATGLNPDYAFKLRRAAAGSDWLLVSFESRADGSIASIFSDEPCYRSASPFLHVGHHFLPDLLEDTEFTLKDVRRHQSNGEELVRLSFSYRPTQIANNPERDGWADLDPARFWIVRELELRAEWPEKYRDGKPTFLANGTISKRFEFQVGTSGFPIPTKVIRRQRAMGSTGAVDLESVTEHRWSEHEKVAKSEFQLAMFGLPEPKPPRGSMLYLWLTGIAATCLAAGLWLRKRIQNSRHETKESSVKMVRPK